MRKALGLVLLLPLAACGSEADIPAIEQEVASGIEEQLDISGVTVECPDKIEWDGGGEFHCFAEDADGVSSRVTVSMENDEGAWSWVVG